MCYYNNCTLCSSLPSLSCYGLIFVFLKITVSWEATPITASAADYNPSIGVVTLPSGVQSMPLPLSIFDDGEPEFQEEFTVRIVGVSGGARLGSLTSATVTIDSSDDPNGALGESM